MIKGFLKIILIILSLVFLAGYFIGNASADLILQRTTVPKAIDIHDYTITLSDTCIALLKINVTTCPSYADILQVFPDTSDKNISGDFEYNFGYYHRQPTKYKNQYKFYDYYSLASIVWVDPPHDVTLKARNIVIAAAPFDYKLKHEKVDTTQNNTLTVGTNRYVTPKCTDAIITKDNWLFLLGDTIRYMQHDCDKNFTDFDEHKIVTWQREHHDITTSYKYQLDKWTKEAIAQCGKHYCIPK